MHDSSVATLEEAIEHYAAGGRTTDDDARVGRDNRNHGSDEEASVSEAKNNPGALPDQVRSGSAVLIVDRGRPVARLEPAGGPADDGVSRLAQLVRDGVVGPARHALPARLLALDPPRAAAGASALRALLEERHEGP